MSATNFTPIQLYRTSTAAAAPTAGNLAAGELAINLTDEKLYFKNAAGVVKLLADSSGALGSVTSVAVSGGTTGLTTSGGPITSSGTITLAGTLGVANGGTGATTLSSGYLVKGNGTSAVSASVVYDTGTNVGIGTSSPGAKLDVSGAEVRLQGSASFYSFYDTAGTTRSGYIQNNAGSIALVGELVQPMTFWTSNAERMRITSVGDVAVGTSSPGTKFHTVGGNVWSSNFFEVGRFQKASGTGVTLGYDNSAYVATIGAYSHDGTASNLAFWTYPGSGSAAERMRIDSSGNVGIGTSSPTYKFDVLNAGDLSARVRNNNAGSGLYAQVLLETNNTFNGTSQAAIRGVSTNGGNADIALTFGTSTGTSGTAVERMRIDASGNVGIGTTSPSTIFDVLGVFRVRQSANAADVLGKSDNTGGLNLFGGGAFNAGAGILIDGTSSATPDIIRFTRGAFSESMRITSTGNVGIGTTNPTVKLAVASGAVGSVAGFSDGIAQSLVMTTGTGYFGFLNPNYGAITFRDPTNVSEFMRIDNLGNVGIGTSSPTKKLSIETTPSAPTNGFNIQYSGSEVASFTSNAGTGEIRIGATGTGTYFPTFYSNNTERMRIDASGNVGIGTSSPASTSGRNITIGGIEPSLVLNASSNRSYSIASGGNFQYTPSALCFVDNTAGATRMIITSAGNVGIGLTSPTEKLTVEEVNAGVGISGGTGTAGSPAYTNLNFRGYARNRTAVIRSFDQSASFAAGGGLEFLVNQNMLADTVTSAMRIDASGNVGIGTSSPVNKLHVAGDSYFTGNIFQSSNAGIFFNGNAAYGSGVYSDVAGTALRFNAGSSERMRIDSSGNVGIGTSSVAGRLHSVSTSGFTAPTLLCGDGVGTFRVVFNTVNYAGVPANKPWLHSYDDIYIGSDATTSFNVISGGGNVFNVSSAGNTTITGSGNPTLTLASFAGAYSSVINMNSSAGGGSVITASQSFSVQTASAERMRIDSSGNLLVGTTSASTSSSSGVKVLPAEGGANNPQLSIVTSASTATTASLAIYSTGASALRFYVDNGGTIYATNTSISAISDQRFKENVRDLDTGLGAILALKPRRFDWKEGKGKDVKDDMGFIAQEVETVLPALVGGWKAGEGEPDDLKSVKAGDLIPVLVKAIQELTARVAQLEGN